MITFSIGWSRNLIPKIQYSLKMKKKNKMMPTRPPTEALPAPSLPVTSKEVLCVREAR